MIEETGLRCLDECGAMRGVVYFYKLLVLTAFLLLLLLHSMNVLLIIQTLVLNFFIFIVSLVHGLPKNTCIVGLSLDKLLNPLLSVYSYSNSFEKLTANRETSIKIKKD